MTASCLAQRRALALHLASRGFGYVILESPTALVDWGVKSTRTDKTEKTLAKVGQLIEHYSPEVVVIEDCDGETSRRCRRIEQLLTDIDRLATDHKVRVCHVPMQQVRSIFPDARTRHQTALIVAQQLPDLAPHLPRHRKPWMCEDYRMAIFNAASLGLTYFYTRLARSRTKIGHPST